ncbi:ATP-binding protein [Streptomyces sp. NPDC001858]
MSHLRAPAARADRREGGRHGRPVARTAPASTETHIRPQLLRLAVLPPTAVALSACAVVLFTVRSTGVRPGVTLWAVLAGAVAVTGAGIVIAAVAADRAARSVSDRIAALRRGSARGEADLRTVVEALRRGETPPQRRSRGGPPGADADDFELLAADLARAHDGAVTAVVQAAQLSSQAGSEQKLEVFVNLARRLQSLVHREISILDELENEIEDPDLLKGLFHVDHLATRIRRHAENLAVLGGAVSRRQWSNPVCMTEVLRSAIAEVEQYSRVKLVPPIDGELRGHAVADVIHLLAELVENATVFSAPHTQVLLRATLVTSGLAVEVEDRGLGLPVEEQSRMNALLADPDQVNVGRLLADGRIGLFVVSQLARRHGIRVRLQSNIYGGVQAVLVVPQALLGSAPGVAGAVTQGPDMDGAGLPLVPTTTPAPTAAARPPLPPAPPARGQGVGDTGPTPLAAGGAGWSAGSLQTPGATPVGSSQAWDAVTGPGAGRSPDPSQPQHTPASGVPQISARPQPTPGPTRSAAPQPPRPAEPTPHRQPPDGPRPTDPPLPRRSTESASYPQPAESARHPQPSRQPSDAPGSAEPPLPRRSAEPAPHLRSAEPVPYPQRAEPPQHPQPARQSSDGLGSAEPAVHLWPAESAQHPQPAPQPSDGPGSAEPPLPRRSAEPASHLRSDEQAPHLRSAEPMPHLRSAESASYPQPAESAQHPQPAPQPSDGPGSAEPPLPWRSAESAPHLRSAEPVPYPQHAEPPQHPQPAPPPSDGPGSAAEATLPQRPAESASHPGPAEPDPHARSAESVPQPWPVESVPQPSGGRRFAGPVADPQRGAQPQPQRVPQAADGARAGGRRPAPLPVRGAREARANPAEAVPGIRPGDRAVVEEHAGLAPTPRVGTVRGTMGKPQLPRRRAQEHIVPQLRGGPAPRQDSTEEPAGHDPGLMASFQRGVGLAEAQQSLEADFMEVSSPAAEARTDLSTARHDGSAPAG